MKNEVIHPVNSAATRPYLPRAVKVKSISEFVFSEAAVVSLERKQEDLYYNIVYGCTSVVKRLLNEAPSDILTHFNSCERVSELKENEY